MIRPRSPAPASSSASTPKALFRSIAATSRPEDEAPTAEPEHATDGETRGTTATTAPNRPAPTVHRAAITIGGQAAEPEEDEDDAVKPLPDRLVMELTAHRTLALRDAVANNPHVAMTALLHKLAVDTFQRTSSTGGCLEATVRHVFFTFSPPT